MVFGATVADTSYFDFAMRTVCFSSNSVLVTTNHPEAILLGSVAEVKVEFTNHFGVPLTNTRLHILGDEGLTSGGQISTVVNVGSVPVGGLISVTRSFDARSVGEHLVVAKLTCDEDLYESGSALVQVNAVCVADFDHDGVVTGDDQDAFVEAFEAGDISADVDGDGFVGGDDFDIFMIAFEAGC